MADFKGDIVLVNNLFITDVRKQRFTDARYPQHNIPFANFRKEGDHRLIAIDPDTRDIHAGWKDPKLYDGYQVMVRVPEIVFKQSFMDDEKRIRELNQNSLKEVHNFYLMNEGVRNRIAGKRPVVYAEGHAYKFLIEKKELVLLKNEDIRISTRYMKDEDDLKTMIFILDKNTLLEGRLTDKDSAFPEHFSVLRIPNPTNLDPIGDALLRGKSAVDFLVRFPYAPMVTAKEVPWIQSSYARIIDQNLRHNEAPSEKAVRAKGTRLSS